MREKTFLQQAIPYIIFALAATYCYRRVGYELPGWPLPPARTPQERLEEALRDVNAHERHEGRAPLALTRL